MLAELRCGVVAVANLQLQWPVFQVQLMGKLDG